MNNQMQAELQLLANAVTAIENLPTRNRRVMPRYSSRIKSCVNGLKRLKDQFRTSGDGVHKITELTRAINNLRPILEGELNAVENVLIESPRIRATGTHTTSASNYKFTVALNIRSNFDIVQRAIEKSG